MHEKMRPKKHVHRYQLKDYGKRKVYACTLPDCTHYQVSPDMLRGKLSLCNQCGNEFILTTDIISDRVVRPRCKNCKAEKRLGGPKPKPKQKEETSLDDALTAFRAKLGL